MDRWWLEAAKKGKSRELLSVQPKGEVPPWERVDHAPAAQMSPQRLVERNTSAPDCMSSRMHRTCWR